MNATQLRKLIVILALGAMLAIAGCTGSSGEDSGGEELAEDTGTDVDADIGESYYYEVKVTESNQADLVRKRPPFKMEDSLERQNLIERYKHLNDRNNVHHVYLMGEDGQVIAYFTAQGKVSSVNSKLTNDVQIVRVEGCKYGGGQGRGAEGSCYKTVESPQMDGSYGTNGDAIFFFTTAGEYVEWNGKYVVSEEPKSIQTPVSLTAEAGDGNSANAQNAENGTDPTEAEPSDGAELEGQQNESGNQTESGNQSG